MFKKKQPKTADSEMKIHYKELFETSVNELKFQRLLNDSLISIIDECITISKDVLVCAVLENAKNRYELDKLIHSRNLFPDV